MTAWLLRSTGALEPATTPRGVVETIIKSTGTVTRDTATQGRSTIPHMASHVCMLKIEISNLKSF
ncbi:hypothetical protein MJO28_010214 [Puccinia striiformis f. sp. tritici]|uniref:Uncharacterized protein n=1 Tax=Puccinia striiformis f. sp. tritici TaxID=168172 RepID=A0ACC0E3W3_9BASI|nr:hypothetical protein MJO28_010214 [Puccinia striiformis f. sp. tritici]